MKLIIDIPYESYYTFKSDLGKGNLNALAEIVANGTPYEERLQGEWIDHEKHIECNHCRVWFLKDYLIRKSFCPNCGADMRGEEE